MKIPAWAMKEEKYEPTRDRDYFISRSLLRVMRVLFSFQQQARRPDGNRISAVAALCFLIGWLVLTVSAHRGAFLLCQLAFELLLLCLLDGRALRQLLGNALAASVFSAFLVLPAIWLGNGSNVLLIPCKTFLTVAALGLLTRFLPWNQLTAAMRVFHLPQVVIFIFDTTLRYIVLLGEIAGEMLTALGYPQDFVHAVLAHGWEYSGVKPETLCEKTLYTVDELTGFITAVALVRPSKSLMDLEVKSVKKKWKDKGFARAVNRDVIERGSELMGEPLEVLIERTIESLKPIEKELGLGE